MPLLPNDTINFEEYKVTKANFQELVLVDELIDLAGSVQEIEIQKIIHYARTNEFFGMKPLFKHYAKRFLNYEFGKKERGNLDLTSLEKRKLDIFFDEFFEIADKLMDHDLYEEDLSEMLIEYKKTEASIISRLFVKLPRLHSELDHGEKRVA